MEGKLRVLGSLVLNIMIDPKKLNSQISFKDLDLDKLTKALSEHQNSVIKLVLVIGALLLAGVMFNGNRVKVQALKLQVSKAQQKLDAFKARDAAVGNLNAFKSSLPKRINEFELITLISNYAKSYNVTIPSLSPGESKDMGLYDAIDISFSASSDSFKNMMLFLRKIEKSDLPLRVNSWAGDEAEDGTITFTFQIDISAVLIHP
jgi:hypothetical protein